MQTLDRSDPGGTLTSDLVVELLPGLGRSSHAGFNVFDVMRHGTHEKQLSNVFRWLLEADGSHGLGDQVLRAFIDEVNRVRAGQKQIPHGTYVVRQEVNTSTADEPDDIADLVLTNDQVALVVENYYTSDGHGHDYSRYLRYAQRDGRAGAVVLLCLDQDGSLQTDGWEGAAVVAYGAIIGSVWELVRADARYQREHPDAYSFIDQMYRKFVKGRGRMDDNQVLDFVTTMCASGEARRYQEKAQDSAAEKFADDIAEQARERFTEGRDVLMRVKGILKNYVAHVLRKQLDATMGADFVGEVDTRYAGIYQWTVNIKVARAGENPSEARLQFKFGPSAWYANEADSYWKKTVPRAEADYSRLFITSSGAVHQSAVSLREVLEGLDAADRRLHDEIVRLVGDRR